MIAVLMFVLAYVLGSLCSAVIVCRTFSLPDPRLSGSSNPGTTNVLRIAGKKYAVIVLIADMLKGFLPVLIAKQLSVDASGLGWIALAAVLGHIYPVFFRFQGGKGVATFFGALFGLSLTIGALTIGTWFVVALIFGYSSLAAIAAISGAPFYSIVLLKNVGVFPPIMLASMLIFYKHHENIRRLFDRKEEKIQWRRKRKSD